MNIYTYTGIKIPLPPSNGRPTVSGNRKVVAVMLVRNDSSTVLKLAEGRAARCIACGHSIYQIARLPNYYCSKAKLTTERTLAANGFKDFFPTVIKTLGFGKIGTLTPTCPHYLIAASWPSSNSKERTGSISNCSAVVGFLVACRLIRVVGKCVAMVVSNIETYGVNSLILSVIPLIVMWIYII